MTSRRAALYALGVVFAANFFNYIDRNLVSALEKPLKSAFALDSEQFGLLWTLFTIGYMVCAPLIGFLADRYSRTRLLAVCIAVWSLATVASGMAQDRHVLYASRVLIGVGEAGCLIIGPSLISDAFPREQRGRALSIFYLGLPIGGTAAFLMAGALIQNVDWRAMFYIAGLPGFLIAALIWVLAEPPRGVSEGAAHGMARGRFRDYVRLLRTRTLLLIILAQAFAVVVLVPLIHFGTEFFTGTRGMGDAEARLALGGIALVAGALGNSVSGIVGDRLSRRVRGAYALLAGLAYLVAWPCLLAGFHAGSRWVFIPAIALGCFFLFFCMPAVNTQIANVTSPAQRATAWALAVFVLHLLGDTMAPWLFGKVDKVLPRQEVFTIFSFALLAAGALCLLAARTAAADSERVTERIVKETRIGLAPQPQEPV